MTESESSEIGIEDRNHEQDLTMTPVRFENIQALRGVAVLLVVLCHLQVIEQKYSHGEIFLPDWLNYAMASVDLFFVISGFVIATVTRGQFQSLKAAGHFIFQRVTRIYPTYWFYSTIVLIIWWYKPEMVNSAQGNQVNILASFLIIPQDLLPLVMVGWTLIHEMYFYIVVAIFMPVIPERRFPVLLALWALVVIGGSSFLMINPDAYYHPAVQIIFHPLTFNFIGGVAIALLLNGATQNNHRLIFSIGISGFLFSLLWFNMYESSLKPESWLRIFLFGIPSFLVVYSAARAEKISGKSCFPKSMKKIGDASYSIYLSHVLVLAALGRIWAKMPVTGTVIHIAILLTMILTTIIVGLISYRWIEIPILNKMRTWRLSNEKSRMIFKTKNRSD